MYAARMQSRTTKTETDLKKERLQRQAPPARTLEFGLIDSLPTRNPAAADMLQLKSDVELTISCT